MDYKSNTKYPNVNIKQLHIIKNNVPTTRGSLQMVLHTQEIQACV